MLPLWVFGSRTLRTTSAISLLVGGLILGLSSYVPTLGQEVVGASAIVSGFALAALTLGWPVSAALSGRLYLTIGFRATGLLGVALAIAGSLVLALWTRPGRCGTSPLGCLLIGFGMGWVAARRWSSRSRASPGASAGSPRRPTCSPARSGRPSASRCSVRWSTPSSGTTRPGTLATGVHRVFVGILVLALRWACSSCSCPSGSPRPPRPAPAGRPQRRPASSSRSSRIGGMLAAARGGPRPRRSARGRRGRARPATRRARTAPSCPRCPATPRPARRCPATEKPHGPEHRQVVVEPAGDALLAGPPEGGGHVLGELAGQRGRSTGGARLPRALGDLGGR